MILDDFNDPKILESSIYDHAYFVTSKSKESALMRNSIYLLYPDDQEMLIEQSIPDNVTALKKNIRLKMNKKLD